MKPLPFSIADAIAQELSHRRAKLKAGAKLPSKIKKQPSKAKK